MFLFGWHVTAIQLQISCGWVWWWCIWSHTEASHPSAYTHTYMHAIACSRREITDIRTNVPIRVARDHANVHLRCAVTIGQLNSESQMSALFLSFSSRFSYRDRRNGIEHHSSTLPCPVRPPPFNPTVSTYLLHESFHLMCCVPLRLFPGTGASSSRLCSCPSPLTCPYHFSSFSVIFLVTVATFTDHPTCSFLILSFFVISRIHRSILTSITYQLSIAYLTGSVPIWRIYLVNIYLYLAGTKVMPA